MESIRNWGVQWGGVGILLGLPFVFPSVWWVALIGVGGFLLLLQKTQSATSVYLGAWFAWTLKYLIVLSWFWSVYPIDWLSIDVGKLQLVFIGLSWIICGVSLGIGGVVFACMYMRARRICARTPILLYVLLPLAWVVAEVIGSYAFSIASIGPGGAITSAFSFGYSGYLLAQHELLSPLARIAGVYGLTVLFFLGGYAVFRFYESDISQPKRQLVYICILVFFASSYVSFLSYPVPEGETYTVATIDTRFSPAARTSEEGREIVNEYLYEAVEVALAEGVEYILLPEDSRLFDQTLPVSTNKATFRNRFPESTTVLLDSGRFEQNGENAVLQAFIYDGVENSVKRVQKRYLVPQGEFLSSFPSLILRLFGFGEVIDTVEESISFRVGPYTDQSELGAEIPGVLFCFESVDPLGVRTILAEKPDVPFIAHPVSHAWFHEPESLWPQLHMMLQVQAVWNQVYIVSAGNDVSGAVYAPNGTRSEPVMIDETAEWSVNIIDIPH